MHHDSRVYVELRYDGESMDVVVVAFRDRGIMPIETVSREYSFDSPVLQEDLWHEISLGLHRTMMELDKED